MPDLQQMDGQRLVHRAADAAATGSAAAVSDMAVRIALAEEMRDQHAARASQLEQELELARAENARLVQVNAQLQQPSPAAAGDDSAGGDAG